MNNLYNVLDELRTLLLLSDFTNTVTFGEVSDVDLNKLTNFPLVHLNVDNVTIDDLYIDFTLNMIACDVVDISKEEVSDLFLGNNNVQDILSTQLKVITDASNFFRNGDLRTNNFVMTNGTVTATPFLDKFENQLAGWEASITLRSAMQDKC
jgi:hypothetical protein